MSTVDTKTSSVPSFDDLNKPALDAYNAKSYVDQWRLYMSVSTGLASQDEMVQYMAFRDDKYKDAQLDRCRSTRDYLLSSSPGVLFMLGELKKIGCDLPTSAVSCEPCVMQKGGFQPGRGIKICSNQVVDQGAVEKTMMHELIHAFDHCRFNVDWMNKKHHACSEIRAASLSGECGWWREYKAGNTGITDIAKHHQECVRRRAARSVAMHPHVKGKEEADFLVNAVFDSCFRDTRPFERIY